MARLHSPIKAAQAAFERRQDRLQQFAHEWDSTINRMLKGLAEAKWPNQRWLGILPIFSTRIRREASPQKIIWWVEHDIPPYDRYRCAAYFIEAELDESLHIMLTVRSESKKYPVKEPINGSLEQNLARAAQDPPVIIPRRMGPAYD